MYPSTSSELLRHSDLSKVNMYTIPISDSLSLRVYSDARPYNWKIANLQKGLILIFNGFEKVGEGTGFGFPVVVYADETYFSGTATVFVSECRNCTVVSKEFHMDRVSRKSFKHVKLQNRKARALLRYLADLYQKHQHLRSLLVESFFEKMGIKSNFVKTPSIGKVLISFTINKRFIHVKADFSLLDRKNPRKFFILNEQSSKFFRRYIDANHLELFDKQIGAWNLVQANWACITSINGKIGFKMWKSDGILRRGREFINNSLDWVGLDYEIDPRKTVFEYEIEILGG